MILKIVDEMCETFRKSYQNSIGALARLFGNISAEDAHTADADRDVRIIVHRNRHRAEIRRRFILYRGNAKSPALGERGFV